MLTQMYWLFDFLPAATPLLCDIDYTTISGSSQEREKLSLDNLLSF
ncbi:hypothetical protein Cylst_3587 [Cylindrospermum stagnale PCC 7417]|uniref:Uncharacterized protein n=1 Tax=Cylindrospermum stagnale PCC 7417 TaxID=56107 RepID=K9WZT9_9NOST|nr:hypothetical protein Cylst_3587 [Cylindrospermum stagnale PCC 7417]